MNLAEFLGVDDRSTTEAVTDGRDTLTRRELFDNAEKVRHLIDATVPSGARVGLAPTSQATSLVDLLGALLAERPVALLPPEADGGELAVAAQCAATIADGRLQPLRDGAARVALATADSPERVVLFTSGSTRLPRGVRLSEANLLSNLTAMRGVGAAGWTPDDRVGQILTLAHSFGLSMALLALAARSPLVMLPDTVPSRRLGSTLTDAGVTVLACVPYYLRLMAMRGVDLGGQSAPGLRHLYLAGGGIGDADLDALIPDFGGKTYLMYGLTEATARVAVRVRGNDAPADSVGLPLPGTHVRIVDEHGKPVPTGETGRIQVCSPGLMIGYVGEPDRPPGQPLTTTDLGHLDAAGHLFVTGREAEMMNFRGHRCSILAVEASVNAVEGVDESRLIPDSADEDAQAELRIVPAPDLDQRDLKRRVLAVVTPPGLVRTVTFVTDLPRTASGKPIRRPNQPD